MKITTLLETNTTPSSDPATNQSQQAPKFGRDPHVLEDEQLDEMTAGATGSGSVATGEPTNMRVQRRGKGSMLQGIKTSKKFPNSAAVKEGAEQRQQNALWAQITDYEKRAKATKNDIKKAHYMKMASELRSKLKTNDEQGVAEAAGLYGPFTVTINTGERPKSRTKTKKFRREDDAILWAQDWLEDFSQYPYASAEVTDPDGNVVWTTDEEDSPWAPAKQQGVAEGSDNIRSMIQQYEDMVELVYDLPPGRKKNIAIDKRDALEAQIEAMPGGSEALRKWAKSYNDAMDEGVAEGVEIIDQDSDLDQQVYTLNVDGNKVSFTYWDYENNFQSPDIKDIYQQAKEQLGKKLSPEQIKAVARAVFKSFKQGVAEATGNTGLPHDFTAVQPGAEVWYKGRFAGWTTGKVYDDPYGKAGKMVAFEPNPSEFPGDDGRILSLPYDEVSLRKSTSIGKLKGPGQGVAEGKKKPHPQTWHDVDPKLGKAVDKMSQAEKVKKGYAHPDTLKKKGVAEGSEEQVYKVVALDKSNALKKPTKLNVKASSIEDVFSRLAANDWYALSINGVEVVAGKRLKQGVAEEKQRLDPKCWTGYKKQGTKMKGGVRVNNCVPVKEAEKYPEPEQEVIDATRRARLQREREPRGSEKIDAMLAQRNAQLQQYTETGKFWLKKKDTQEHISDAYVGKAAANQAALQLLKQHPELKGNIVITAWGPGETPVNEAELSEEQLLARDLKKQLELFKQAVDHDLGTKPNDKELGKKPKDKEVQRKK